MSNNAPTYLLIVSVSVLAMLAMTLIIVQPDSPVIGIIVAAILTVTGYAYGINQGVKALATSTN